MRWVVAILGWVLCWTTFLGGAVVGGGLCELLVPKGRVRSVLSYLLSIAGLLGGIAIVAHLAWDLPDEMSWQTTYQTAFYRFFTTPWGWAGLATTVVGVLVAARVGGDEQPPPQVD